MDRQGSCCALLHVSTCRLQAVYKPDVGNLQDTINIRDVAFNLRNQIPSRLDSPRFQRGCKRAGQSPGHACNHVIKCRRVFIPGELSPVLVSVEIPDSSMDSEMDRAFEAFNPGGSMGTLMLFNQQSTGMDNGHHLPSSSLHKVVIGLL
jgi:hypothetical protein